MSGDGYCEKIFLLDVIIINLENLSEDFIQYDTDDGMFSLPKKGEYMMLVFAKDRYNQNIMTTLRRRTPDKEKYYRENIGQWFNVEFV